MHRLTDLFRKRLYSMCRCTVHSLLPHYLWLKVTYSWSNGNLCSWFTDRIRLDKEKYVYWNPKLHFYLRYWNLIACFVRRNFCLRSPRLVLRGQRLTLTFWRWNYFFFILAHPVYKMWIIHEPNTLELWNKLHFEEKKTECVYHV